VHRARKRLEPMYHSILYYSVLFCSVLFCSVLFCSVLFCSVLFCSVPFRSVPFCSVSFRSFPFRSVPFHSILFCSVLFYSFFTFLCTPKFGPSPILSSQNISTPYFRNWNFSCRVCSGLISVFLCVGNCAKIQRISRICY